MTLFVILSILSTLLFGAIAIIFSYKEEQARLLLLEREKRLQHRFYELSVLKQLQDKISYTLDIGQVVDIIMADLHNILSFSSVSAITIHNKKLIHKAYLQEAVSDIFLEQTMHHMTAGLATIMTTSLPNDIEEHYDGITTPDITHKPIGSFFQIPLIVNEKPVGIINVSSKYANYYTNEENTLVTEIVGQASHALSRLEQVLQLEEGKLTATISSLADGVFMIDETNTLTVINETAKSFLHIQTTSPTTADVLEALRQSDGIESKIEEAKKERKSITENDATIGQKTFQVVINPVMDNQSTRIIGISVLMHDITVEKSLSQMKDDFTNMVVHELRAPLTVIKDASSLVATSTKMSKEEQNKLLLIMNQQAKKMLDEIGTILDAAKFEAGKFTLEKSPTDLRKLIEERLEFFLPQAQNKHIHLLSNLDERIPAIVIDPNRIGQVINNLVSNSLKFTPEEGKIIISLTTSTHESLGNKHMVTISVSDTGSGIPKEKQTTLFNKYIQITANQPHTQPGIASSGTGLGLYVVKKIIEAHNGIINLKSEPGYGTTISFTIPFASELQAKQPASHRLIN